MKKTTLIIGLLCLVSSFALAYEAEDISLANWKVFTNTTYIHQLICNGDSVVSASWGGVSIYDTQHGTFTPITKGDGLAKNELWSVHYIPAINEYWFGTFTQGIMRMQDGELLKPYQANQGIDGYFIYDIDDNDEYIFVASENGLSMFEILLGGKPIFKKTFIAPRWISNNKVNSIAIDDNDRIWIATDAGIDYTDIVYDEMILSENWHHISTSTPGYPLSGDKITTIAYQNSRIYFGTENGFAYIKDIYADTFEYKAFNVSLPSSYIQDIQPVSDSLFLVAFGRFDDDEQAILNAAGVSQYSYSGTQWTAQHWDEDSDFVDQVSDITLDEEQTIWVSTWGNDLYRKVLQDNEWQNVKRNCLGFNFASYAFIDYEQRLWVASGIIGFGARQGVKGISVFSENVWTTYDIDNSKLVGNKSFRITQDLENRIWIGDWNKGITRISDYGEETELWQTITNSPTCDVPGIIEENTTSFLQRDEYGNMWIGDYNRSIKIVVNDDSVYSFEAFIPSSHPSHKQDPISILFLPYNQVWFGAYFSGMRYWNGTVFPETQDIFFPEGNPSFSGPILSIAYQDSDEGRYLWACGVDGLYMYDFYWQQWFRYTNGLVEDVKMYRWNGIEWENYDYYWYDEEGNPESRMGAGKSSQINQVYVDQHGRKWIATNGGGISMLDEENYTFTNFTTENSSLPSDVVLSFAHDIYTGELYVGTAEGMCVFNIGAQINNGQGTGSIKDVVIYPNPFKPNEHSYIYFESSPYTKLPTGENMLYVYNLAGELVVEIEESDHFRFFWDGKNNGKEVASGIYFYVLSSKSGKTYLNGKFAIIR